ncbi:prolyl oligopeptidase family serine peptidase [Sphingopyxis sp. GW247-27LB]|jgi:dipeptidyl aminopeptidase/acylaminoacyl peptidase|uniref:prolyl oligopeptidase family serine peptidase n=1 Tax=Sphingopyxis sp. GW247-27LB TaxID=2012632 RepID=UPI000BA71B2D|nr:prolyl oligopeptidase family serine peptidase [Sphingopyxis sp. GW247-27LB]PAL24289.1 prolyl oligopeptidase [Sphingopyxis sp. GW247-27LB]
MMMAKSVTGTLAAALAIATPVVAEPLRHWTLQDLLSIPEVRALSLSADGRTALYVVRVADMRNDRVVAVLRRVELKSGATRDMLRVRWIDQLRRIPGEDAWSALIDKGDGVQLYRLTADGTIAPLVVHPATAIFGDAEGAIYPGYGHAPLATGVRAHDWSPDGKRLFYVVLDAAPRSSKVRHGEQVVIERARRRAPGTATASIYLRSNGQDSLIATRPQSDLSTFFARSFVRWKPGAVLFDVTEVDAADRSHVMTLAWSFKDKDTRAVGSSADSAEAFGPHGGQLSSEGFGERRELVETVAGGETHSYGRVAFALDGRAVSRFRSADGKRTIVGIRTIENPRFGLAVLDAKKIRRIGGALSLNNCDFTPSLGRGACIAQSQTQPPTVVEINVASGQIRRIASVSPKHEQLAPLQIEPRTWTNRHGYKATGYIVWPRGYDEDRHYPAIVITHGTDADQRFANRENQWEYPAQLFAERGYVVLLINDYSARENAEVWSARQAWINETKSVAPETMRRMIWLNGVASYEDAVMELVNAGVIDRERVGIAGYSRGSQMVNVTITNSTLFRAASSGDGGYLEPAFYPDVAGSYDAVFGGPPTDLAALVHYRQLSPSLRAEKVCAAVLQQVAAPLVPSIDFHTALRKASVPAELSLYPGEDAASDETHIFHIPSNRLGAMQENIAWFDYWLLGKRDSTSPVADRYTVWDKMRDEAQPRCNGARLPLEG